MKVLTIKQPWASLIINGYKEYEFRTWHTNYRGTLYIQASKSIDKESMNKFKSLNLDYPTGCLIGKCYIDDCITIDNDFRKKLKNKKYSYIYDHVINGDYNKYGFHIVNPEKIELINVKGKLGIWNYN